MCGRAAWGGARRGSGTGGASRSGRTTLERARPVAGSMSSSAAGAAGGPKVVPAGGSAENAGDTSQAAIKRRSALKRIGGEALEPGLYVVATPIGNLGDITARAADVLGHADVIAAEDTRNTRGLLTHLGISARLIALHEHNERRGAERVVEWIRDGKSVALVSDAGTPGVSDPGAEVVAAVRAAGLRVVPIPGASALTAALSAAGFAFEGAVFAGFLAAKGAARREKLAALAAGPWAIVLFEAPHRVAQTLGDLHEALGERDVVIAREITKRFESIERVPLATARAWVEADDDRRRGEFVLVIEGRQVEKESSDPRAVLRTLLAELPLKQAVALAVKLTGAKRNDLYQAALEMKKGA
jgi:16S rRNA (cytidine1402-2'-O)-methyltransferase